MKLLRSTLILVTVPLFILFSIIESLFPFRLLRAQQDIRTERYRSLSMLIENVSPHNKHINGPSIGTGI